MPLTVLYSDNIDRLADDLTAKLQNDDRRREDALAFTQVVVPNANIGKWLGMRKFSAVPRLSAGIEFPFITGFLRQTLRASLRASGDAGDAPASDSAATRDYTYAVLRILLTDPAPDLAPFRKYIWPAGDDQKPGAIADAATARLGWQLAQKLASLADLYEARRPDLVDGWLSPQKRPGGKTPDTPVARAEIALINALFGEQGVFPDNGDTLSLRQLFRKVQRLDCRPAVKGNLYFFGHSALTRLQAEILYWLAPYANVFFYYNNVCLEYWGDISRPNWKRRVNPQLQSDADASLTAIENPLLSSWGLAGRETLRILCEMDESNRAEPWFTWEETGTDAPGTTPDTVLAAVQASIRERTSELARRPQDATLQIFGAPGIRREVETVYNAILEAVTPTAGRPACTVSDIAVLVPDMAVYRPYIEAVFAARGEIPYGIIDTTAEDFSRYLSGLLALVALHQQGLTRDTLFAVLENPLVQQALHCDAAQVRAWRDLTGKIGAFAYFDSGDARARGADGSGTANVTWDAALRRLRLAGVAKSLAAATPDAPVPADNVLCDGDGLRFSAIVELLYRELRANFGTAGEKKSSWSESIAAVLRAFLPEAPEDPLELSVRAHILETLAALDCHRFPEHSLDFAVEAIQLFAGSAPCGRGGYLTHGVTIAGLQPMRPVPFKQVFILGLGEGNFPGTRAESTLDLRMQGLNNTVKDAALPDINRFLFLETVMAVRDRLVLSYVNRDTRKDAELFPCSVVRELKDFLSRHVLPRPEDSASDAAAFKEVIIPLQEADLPDTAAYARGLSFPPAARALARRIIPSGGAADAPEAAIPAARALAEFLRDPFHAVFSQKFSIEKAFYREKKLVTETPLAMDAPEFWNLQQEMATAEPSAWASDAADPADDDRLFQKLFQEKQRRGTAPGGFIGDFEAMKCRAACARIPGAAAALAAAQGAWGEAVFASVDMDKKSKKIKFPPEPVFHPWLKLLEKAAAQTENGTPITLTVTVIDCESAGKTGEGIIPLRWRLTPPTARDYLAELCGLYAGFLARPLASGQYPDWKYRDIIKKYGVNASWAEAARVIGSGEGGIPGDPGTNRYKPDLVIEKVLAEHIGTPEEEDFPRLAAMLEKMYGLLMACTQESGEQA